MEHLLLHRAHHGPDFAGDWAWTFPAGCRQPGERVYLSVLRELAFG
jgi:8-oxo-dGTP pyrophosphatase MutT (NUDIX family)